MRSLLLLIGMLYATALLAETSAPEVSGWMLYFSVAVTALLGISEALSMIPVIKSNGIFQAIWNILKAIGGKD